MDIEYVKPTALDLGALTFVYGSLCSTTGSGAVNCVYGGGDEDEGCQSGNNPRISCLLGGSPNT